MHDRWKRLVGLVGLVMFAGAFVASAAQAPVRSVWDGVYSAKQVERGTKIYAELCVRCHGETLLGADNAKPLVGDEFLQRWHGKTLFDLFDLTRRKMPNDGPGVLSRREAADVTAFLLSQNAVPAGTVDLGSDDESLARIGMSRSH